MYELLLYEVIESSLQFIVYYSVLYSVVSVQKHNVKKYKM